jgi:uncharacterized protein with HEPN domain
VPEKKPQDGREARFGVDDETLWDLIQHKLPGLKAAVIQLLEPEPGD